jgi:hypothetical protein
MNKKTILYIVGGVIIVLLIFLLSSIIPKSTSEIDGKYNYFTLTSRNEYVFVYESEFKSGKLTHFYKSGEIGISKFKVVDKNTIEIQFEDKIPYQLKINRDENNKVISLSETYGLYERIN